MSKNIFEMSDEEILALDPSTLVDDDVQAEDQPSADETAAAADDAQDQEESASNTDGESTEDVASDSAEKEDEEDSAEGADQGAEVEAGDEGAKASDEGTEGQAEASKEQPKAETPAAEEAVQYEAEYKKLLAPFVANGKEMAVKNVDEAISLMQMGANYNKKMAALKPNLKLIKLLDSSGLLSEEKISYLIDLANQNAGAINKLVKDSGIDPMDLSAEKADEYRPTVRQVNDKELELDQVLEEIQESPAYQRTLGVVGKEWDVASRQVVADNPQLLKVINSHVQSGIYDVIQAEMERERTFGRLQGLSDIEAYRQVGDAIQARKGFDHLVSSAGTQGQQTPAKPVVVPPKPKQAVDEAKLKEKRKAAGSAKPAGNTSGVPEDFNPLAMSDEEFSKLVKPRFL